MTHSQLLLTIILMSLVTLVLRVGPLVFLEKFNFPEIVRNSLEYIPVSILSVLLISEIFMKKGYFQFRLTDPFVGAALFAFPVAFLTRSLTLTVVLGVVSSAIFRLIL